MVFSLLLVRQGSATSTVREHLLQAAGDGCWHELFDISAERRDLLHAARGYEADLRARHHVDGLDVGSERPVQLVHLELPLEVGDDAQPLDDRAGLPTAGGVVPKAAGEAHPPRCTPPSRPRAAGHPTARGAPTRRLV